MRLGLHWRFLLAGIAALALASSPAGGREVTTMGVGSVPYASGGVGKEARAWLETLAEGFNVKFVFALASGAYLSGVQVAIADASGNMRLEATSEGPIFLVQLPAGDYTVAAISGDVRIERKITITTDEKLVVQFRWPGER